MVAQCALLASSPPLSSHLLFGFRASPPCYTGRSLSATFPFTPLQVTAASSYSPTASSDEDLDDSDKNTSILVRAARVLNASPVEVEDDVHLTPLASKFDGLPEGSMSPEALALAASLLLGTPNEAVPVSASMLRRNKSSKARKGTEFSVLESVDEDLAQCFQLDVPSTHADKRE